MAARQHPAGPAAAMFEADRASRALGIELAEIGDGTATVRMTITPHMLNGHATAPRARGTQIVAEFRGRSRTTG
jgi:acyl-coenzyme A thioesterase PaaI-like protein